VTAVAFVHGVVATPAHLAVQLPPAYVHPGHVAATAAPGAFVTILGSCVAVCLHDRSARVGGLNHFLLPHPVEDAEPSPRYALPAIEELIRQVVAHGARHERLVAHVVGGATVLAAFASDSNHLGKRNVAAAYEILARRGIGVSSSDVGGIRGRKLVFSPYDGTHTIHLIGR